MLALLDCSREPANLRTSRFRNQAGWELLQLRQQRNLTLIEDGIKQAQSPASIGNIAESRSIRS